jgi:hypothetical protein
VAPESARHEERALNNRATLAVFVWKNRPLEPSSTRHLHLCAKAQKIWSLDFFNAPKVERFVYHQVIWVATTAPQANTAN